MKTIFKGLIGAGSALIFLVIAYALCIGFNIEPKDAEFIVGWGSCAVMFESTRAFEKWYSEH